MHYFEHMPNADRKGNSKGVLEVYVIVKTLVASG